MEDYYATLRVDRSASYAEIRRSFQALALKHHPDKVQPRGHSATAASTICISSVNCPISDNDDRTSTKGGAKWDLSGLKNGVSSHYDTQHRNISELNCNHTATDEAVVTGFTDTTHNCVAIDAKHSGVNPAQNKVAIKTTAKHVIVNETSNEHNVSLNRTNENVLLTAAADNVICDETIKTDAQNEPAASACTGTAVPFHAITKAWRVLGDAELRQVYDAAWLQRGLCQIWPVQDRVTVDELEPDEEGRGFGYLCRCGGEYFLDESDILFKVDYVCCQTCSLCLQILYP